MAERREKGQGTVFQRKDGKWVSKIVYNGKAKTRISKTQKEAKQKLKELQRDVKQAKKRKTVGFEDYTVKEYFDLFLDYKKRTLNNVSYRRIESTIQTHILPYFEFELMMNLDEDKVQQVLDEAVKKDLSYSSVKKINDAFKACIKFAIEIRRDIDPRDNFMLAVQMPMKKQFKENSKTPRFLNENERKLFIKEALRKYKTGKQVYKYGPALVFIMNTGLREGEMCGLSRFNIDLDTPCIKVCDTAETIKINGKWTTRIRQNETKYNSERIVFLNNQAIDMIHLMLNLFPESEKTDRLIYTKAEGVLPPTELNKTFNRICEALNFLNMDGVGPHCLRHTFATVLFENNIDIKVISELLGHSSVKITQDIYVSISDELKRKTITNIPSMD